MITFSKTTETARSVTAIIATVTPTSSRKIFYIISQYRGSVKSGLTLTCRCFIFMISSSCSLVIPSCSTSLRYLIVSASIIASKTLNYIFSLSYCHTDCHTVIPSLEMFILTALSFVLRSLLTSPSSSSSWWSSRSLMLMSLLSSGSLVMI